MESIESSMKRWTWNEEEKCWELMKYGQIDGDEEDSEDGDHQFNVLEHQSNIEGAEAKENLRPDNQQPKHQQTNFDQFNAKPKFISKPTNFSIISSSSPTQSNAECRIDDADEKVDEEMESIESSMKRWTWNEVEKCWELMKNGQIDGDERNYEVGEVCDDDESEVEEMFENVHEVDQLNGLEHESNIEVAAVCDQRPDNMNTSQSRASFELLNDRNIEHTNQTVQTNSIESVPSPSHRHNTIPVFASKSYPNEHQVTQLNKLPNQSSNQTFKKPSQLKIYNRTHTGEKPYKCDWKDCDRPLNCKKHSNPVPDDESSTFKHVCKHCYKQFQYLSLLTRHIRTHTGEKLYKCSFECCNKTFTQKYDMQSHYMSHTGQHSRVCQHCDKGFGSHTELTHHIRTHTGEKRYKCDWKDCDRSYSSKQYLEIHYSKHFNPVPVESQIFKRMSIGTNDPTKYI